MSARIYLLLISAWTASATLADRPQNQLYLGDAASSLEGGVEEHILWQPEEAGLSRYQLRIPRSGVPNALKYQDSAALFYLSQKSDLGLHLLQTDPSQLSVSLTPEKSITTYTQFLTPALSYHLGVEVTSDLVEPLLGASWRSVSGHMQLDQTSATVRETDAELSWMRSQLKSDERSERLYSVSNQTGGVTARLGTRWFDFFENADLLAEVGVDDDAFVVGAQFEQQLGSADAYVGAVRNFSSGRADLVLGVKYGFGTDGSIAAATQTGLVSSGAQSLKPLRRAALPQHWRDSVHLGKNTSETHLLRTSHLPSFTPSLECLLGCYESDPDPQSIHVNNFGLPGLIDLPSAERLPDGELILTQQLHESLARSGMSFQILPRLGVAFRYSGHGKNGHEANGRGNHDRSFDAHLNLMEESTYFPSLALGLRDFIGTGWYSSEYIVGTKTFGNIAVTGGLGFGRLAGRNTMENPLSVFSEGFKTRDANDVGRGGTLGTINWFQGEAAPFGGISYRHTPDLTFAAEYTSDLMRRESGYLTVASPWNIGAQYRLNDTLSLSAQYLHGSTVSLGANINLNPKRPPSGAGRETAPVPMRKRGGKYQLELTDRSTLLNVLKVDGFEILNLAEYADYVRVDLRNTTYRSYAQALGRASATLQRFTSDNIKRAIIVFHGRGLELSSYTVDLERISAEQVGVSTEIGPEASVQPADAPPLPFDLEPQTKFSYGFGPYFTHRLFNPDLPLSVETGAELGLKYNFTQNFSVSGTLRKSVFTTLTENKRLGGGGSLPKVQSNWGYYDIEGQDGHIHDFKFSYVDRLSSNIFARLHGGLLEPMFAGFGGEILYLPKSSPIALGLDLHRVRQRDFDMRFDLQDYETTVGKASLYFDNGGPFDVEINAGRYLAGDWGATTKLSRRFANGWEVGAYATLTDVPFDVFGEGSFDKGIYVDIPLDWLTGNPSMSKRNFTIRPITRDGGARLASGRQLYKMVRKAQEMEIKREIGRIWK